MWKSTFSFILCVLLSSSFLANENMDNDQEGINQKDAEGKKQGKWIVFGKDRPSEGIPADGKVEEGAYKDDRKEGIWIKYHTDGKTPKLKGEYENNRPKGQYTKYWPNGKVREKGTFEKSMYQDSLIRMNEEGVREFECFYNSAGKEQGKVKHYYPNGQVEFVYVANNGVPTGTAYRYWPNGDVKEVITYDGSGNVTKSETKDPVNPMEKVKDPGQSARTAPGVGTTPNVPGGKWNPNGYNKVYNKNNEIWQDGTFKNGSLWDGKVYKYDSDGILLKVEIFKEGKYNSDGQL